MNSRGLCPSVFKEIKDRKRFFSELDQSRAVRLTCSICKDILVDPQQLECGCRFCLSCISTRRKTSEEGRCPGCKSLAESGEGAVTRDRAVEKEIACLVMVCVNKGCKEKCRLKDLEDHLKGCEFRNERCADCEKEYFHKDLKEHQRRECPMRKVTCVDCGSRMTKEDFKGRHRSIGGGLEGLCGKWKAVCPYRCSPESQDSIKDHLRDCPRMHVGCDLKVVGCLKVLPRGEMVAHCHSDMDQHLGLMVGEIEKIRIEREEMREALAEAEERRVRENYELNQTVTTLARQLTALTKKVETYERTHLGGGGQQTGAPSAPMSKHNTYATPPLARIVTGEFTWTIEGIKAKISDARVGVSPILLSDPFYTGSPGYKMSLKVYPYGDGRATGTHLSLYFVIMMGDYDDQVRWPFNKKVSLTLVSRKVGARNHTINMLPDVNENCYGRPRSSYNLAAGQPHFVSHLDLLDDLYVHDDSITITASVFL